MDKIDVHQAEVVYQAHFGLPVFTLLGQAAVDLHQAMYLALQPFGLGLQDMQVQTGAKDFSELQATYWLLRLNTTVRVYLDRVEVNCSSVHSSVEQVYRQIVVVATDVAQRTIPESAYKSFTIQLALHGIMQTMSVDDFIAKQFNEANTPSGAGKLIGRGLVYYFGEEKEREFSSLLIEKSARIQDGIFLRGSVTLKGNDIIISRLPDIAEANLKAMIGSTGMDWVR
ncbi:MAG: hypothetical protein AABZ34_17230 [Nitrospirota bacterium]